MYLVVSEIHGALHVYNPLPLGTRFPIECPHPTSQPALHDKLDVVLSKYSLPLFAWMSCKLREPRV